MTKTVTSTKDIDFVTLGWSIGEGQVKELPEDETAQKEILANEYIEEVEKSKSQERREAIQKGENLEENNK